MPQKKRSRPATLRDVAERSGVAVSTVSQILGGRLSDKYLQQTQDKVLKAAQELNYFPNASARAMRSGRSNLVGVINFSGESEMGRLAGKRLLIEIDKHGFDSLAIDINWFGGNVERVLREMISARVEGVVISLMREAFGRHFVEIFEQAGIPLISLFGDDRLGIPVIQTDMRATLVAMARHLQTVAHRHLILLSPAAMARPGSDRKDGFRLAMAGRGPCLEMEEEEFFRQWPKLARDYSGKDLGINVTQDMPRYGQQIMVSHYEMGRRLFSDGPLPDAMICRNDRGAFGLLAAARECGVEIPGQVAVTGAENDLFGRFPVFSLTTVQMDVEGACAKTVELLVSRIRDGSYPADWPLFYPNLLLRRSCGRSILPGEPVEQVVSLDPSIPASGTFPSA